MDNFDADKTYHDEEDGIDLPEVRYRLIATVYDEEVFNMDYPDTAMLQEDGFRKAEAQVENQLELMREDA